MLSHFTCRAALLALVAAGLPLLGTTEAHAADSATKGAVRGLAYEGVEAYQAGKYDLASEKLETAYETSRVPSLGLWSARALEKRGLLVEAAERYLEATRLANGDGDQSVQEKAKEDAAAEHDALLPRIPQLVVRVEGAERSSVEVQVNGESYASSLLGVRRPTNPGEVTVSATSGELSAKETTTLGEGETKELTLTLVAPTEAAPEAAVSATPAEVSGGGGALRPALIYGGFGLAVVGFGTGAATGVMALGETATLEDQYHCNENNVCDVGGEDDRARIETLGLISTIGFAAGAVGAGVGIFGLLMNDEPKSESPTALRLDLRTGRMNGVVLSGRF